VRRRRGGGVAVLDWENSGPAQPERELAAILADLAADLSVPEAGAAYRAYRRGGGPATVGEPADFSTAIAVQGHLLRFYADRALDDRQPAEDRTRARRRLTRMLDPPLTPACASQLLDALH
jgi:aminoglycoside phosphotransferase (APT) family kinase protein